MDRGRARRAIMLDGPFKAAMGITAYVLIVFVKACELSLGGAITLAEPHASTLIKSQRGRCVGASPPAQMGTPLTAQPIEIKALKIGNDQENGGIERQRRCRRWTLRRLPGVG